MFFCLFTDSKLQTFHHQFGRIFEKKIQASWPSKSRNPSLKQNPWSLETRTDDILDNPSRKIWRQRNANKHCLRVLLFFFSSRRVIHLFFASAPCMEYWICTCIYWICSLSSLYKWVKCSCTAMIYLNHIYQLPAVGVFPSFSHPPKKTHKQTQPWGCDAGESPSPWWSLGRMLCRGSDLTSLKTLGLDSSDVFDCRWDKEPTSFFWGSATTKNTLKKKADFFLG